MIDLTTPQFEMLQEKLKDIPEKIPIVTARAINRSAEAARTVGSRLVRKNYNIERRTVLDKIKIKKAYPADLVANIGTKGRPLSVRNFETRANTPFPVRGEYAFVSVKKGSGGTIKKSFVATTKKGYTNVFTRVTDKRKPLRSLHGPSMPQMYGREEGIKAMEARATEILNKRLDHEVGRVLGGN